ncbi:MAG: RluA family pseudouridine synthase [Clostridia bacterium]|nr:RluA family pseudouridine synthase [Clostridia bacterium]
MIEITINKNDAGQRADKFILKTFKNMPKSYLYKCLRKKDIKLNKKKLDGDTFLSEGDVLTLYIKDEFVCSERTNDIQSDIVFSEFVIYEDENIILADKPVGISIHGDDSEKGGFVSALKYYLMKNKEFDSEKENSFSPAFCNRIDKNTGGIVIAAKNASALREMNEIIRNREIDKRYLLMVQGCPDFKNSLFKAYLKKDEKNKKAIISKTAKDGFKEIETEFTVIKKSSDSALIEATLLTGRFHQIRAHMSYLGFPLMGDTKYGGKKNASFKYQALYSYKLKFNIKRNSILSYLDGKEFKLKNIWFEKYFN